MPRNYLVTGGAGFIGSNYVARLLGRGERVTIYDNLSRPGAEFNLEWLRRTYGESGFQLVMGDVRDADLLGNATRQVDVIVHLASQVAVTTSVLNRAMTLRQMPWGRSTCWKLPGFPGAIRLCCTPPPIKYTEAWRT